MCSAAAYESEDALSRDESQRGRFETLFTEMFITECKIALNALLAAEETNGRQKQNREVKRITSLSVDSVVFHYAKSSPPHMLT